jgi:GNAT superfamily N-acetyltransferase
VGLTPVGVRVHQVPAEATAALRRRVLRPDAPPDAPPMSAGWPADAVTFAVLDGRDDALATATVMPEPCPWRPDEAPAWRLRGMASDPARRGDGFGRAALDAAVEHCRAAGAVLLWCNARIGAVGFYERAGWMVEGDEFDIADIGPHRPMALRLA